MNDDRIVPRINLREEGIRYEGRLGPSQNIALCFNHAQTSQPRLVYGETCTIHDGSNSYEGVVGKMTPKRTYSIKIST